MKRAKSTSGRGRSKPRPTAKSYWKTAERMAGLGIKFDTLAKMGGAEETGATFARRIHFAAAEQPGLRTTKV